MQRQTYSAIGIGCFRCPPLLHPTDRCRIGVEPKRGSDAGRPTRYRSGFPTFTGVAVNGPGQTRLTPWPGGYGDPPAYVAVPRARRTRCPWSGNVENIPPASQLRLTRPAALPAAARRLPLHRQSRLPVGSEPAIRRRLLVTPVCSSAANHQCSISWYALGPRSCSWAAHPRSKSRLGTFSAHRQLRAAVAGW